MPHAATTSPDLNLVEVVKDVLLKPGEHGKLGAHIGGGDPRIPLLRDFVRQDAPSVPVACHRSFYRFRSGMLGNDVVGDCVIAAIYHAILHVLHVFRLPTPDPDTLTQLCLRVYGVITGYDPSQTQPDGSNPTDQGTDPTQAVAYWQQTGIPWSDGSTHKILGAVQVAPHDGVNTRRLIYEFDAALLSLAMPVAWKNADVWDTGGDPQSDPEWQPGGWGGHEVLGVSFDRYRIAVWTWGGVKLITWRAYGTYGTLGIGVVSQDQIGPGGVSETGVDLTALERDLPQL